MARNSAQAAQRALASSEAGFQVATARLEMGLITLSDSLAAQGQVSDAAIALLRANGEVIVALEALASVVGMTAEQTLAVMNQQQLALRAPAALE